MSVSVDTSVLTTAEKYALTGWDDNANSLVLRELL